MSAADAIRKKMEATGWTQGHLSRLLGSRSRASEILSGKRSVSKAQALKISKAWRIPLGDLIEEA